jgi:hypothetical protein
MKRVLAPNGVRCAEELERAVIREDTLRARREGHQERIRDEPFGVQSRRHPGVDLAGYRQDASRLEVVFELIPGRRALVGRASGKGELGEREHGCALEEHLEIELRRRPVGSRHWRL